MDDAAQRSLLLWSFEDIGAASVASMTDLCDGVLLARLMHRIDPEYLNLELISEHTGGNWALVASNLKALLRAVELYYHEELGQLCEASELVDAHLIAKQGDAVEVAKLAELVLGCAVQCPGRSEYIHPIMQMDASEQASMMHLIESIMHRFQLTSPSGGGGSSARNSLANTSFSYLGHEGESAESLAAQLTLALDKAAGLELRALDLEREKRELTERFEDALRAKQALADERAKLADERDKLVSERQSTLARDNLKIQQIVASEVHALTLELEERREELQRVKREASERLMVLENEVRRQADELDISRSKLGQLAKLEASVAKYKKKLEEVAALRSQVQDLEVHNAQYLDKVLDLESTVKTMPTLKALVERYKNQVVDLETANVEAVANNQVKDQKVRRLQEELDSALGGKEFLESQVEELRSQLASMTHSGQDDALSGGGGGGGGGGGADVTHLASELDMALKAKEALQFSLLQLKQQNDELSDELLQARQQQQQQHRHAAASALTTAATAKATASVQAAAVQTDDTGAAPTATRAVTGVPGLAPPAAVGAVEQQPQLVASAGVLGALSYAPTSETVSSGVAAAQVAVYEEKIQKLVSGVLQVVVDGAWRHELLAAARASVATIREGGWDAAVDAVQLWLLSLLAFVVGVQAEAEVVDSMRVTVAELTNRLKDKESVINELSEQRAKLENYTKKTLHAVQTKYMVAVSSHRNQITEKQERVDLLEKKLKEIRTSYSREQALMMSSFYERRTMLPQGQGPGAGSWLANKRSEERAKRRNA
ncbi:hypothetical protein PybrP1_004443 [[Pythium] brassicae (nom. inval.)]|nr:hypothetical protein PybrP1_004443 [[Pythium] brassicae (nom. inval.)]